MQTRVRPRWMATALVLLLMVVLLTACGSRDAAEARPPRLLPRVVINIDQDGVPKLGPLTLSSIGRLFRQDLSAFYLPPTLVQQLTASDIQHVELVITKAGVLLFANGQPLPYLALDDQGWQGIGDAMDLFKVPQPGAIRWFLDTVINRVGLPLAVKFPVASGAEEIPMREYGTLPQVDVQDVRTPEMLAERSLIAYLDVALDGQGVPTLADTSLTDLQQSLQESGLAIDLGAARLDPALVATLQSANLQHLQLETEPEGAYVYLNGQFLTRLAWDSVRLQNARDLYARWDANEFYLSLTDFFLPYVQPADVELRIFLPRQPGTEEIPPSLFISEN